MGSRGIQLVHLAFELVSASGALILRVVTLQAAAEDDFYSHRILSYHMSRFAAEIMYLHAV